jgi:hypothetical protein
MPGIDPDVARQLVRGVFTVAQGHPKLLELAEAQAANPKRLATLIDSGEQAWRDQGGVPDGFFTTGESAADPEDYLHVLAAWTRTVTDALTPAERDLFWFLCCLEEPDREWPVLDIIWPFLWAKLGHDGQPADLGQALAAVASHGLAVIRPGSDEDHWSFPLHPGIAAAGRAHAGNSSRTRPTPRPPRTSLPSTVTRPGTVALTISILS